MFTYQEVLEKLHISFEFDNTDFNDRIQKFPEFCGDFRDNLEKRVDRFKSRGRKFKFIEVYYYKVEVGLLNGKQFLRLLIWLTNNKTWMKPGNCYVFLVNKQPATSLFVFYDYCFEFRGTPSTLNAEKGFWTKSFDDKKAEERRKDLKYEMYDKRFIEKDRATLPTQYHRYMTENMSLLEAKYAQLFSGVAFEISKCYVKHWMVYEQLKNFPRASLIKLAIDKMLSGMLQATFNEHDMDDEIRSVMAQSNGKDEAFKNVHKYKAQLRDEAAKKLLEKVFRRNVDGLYDEAEVLSEAEKIKAFYE